MPTSRFDRLQLPPCQTIPTVILFLTSSGQGSPIEVVPRRRTSGGGIVNRLGSFTLLAGGFKSPQHSDWLARALLIGAHNRHNPPRLKMKKWRITKRWCSALIQTGAYKQEWWNRSLACSLPTDLSCIFNLLGSKFYFSQIGLQQRHAITWTATQEVKLHKVRGCNDAVCTQHEDYNDGSTKILLSKVFVYESSLSDLRPLRTLFGFSHSRVSLKISHDVAQTCTY